jgi:hypothetical protein
MAKLQTALRVQAANKVALLNAKSFMVAHKGDAQAGILYVVLYHRDGTCRVLTESRNDDGVLGFRFVVGSEKQSAAAWDASEYIARQLRYDPDAWVVDLEQDDITLPFPEPIFV